MSYHPSNKVNAALWSPEEIEKLAEVYPDPEATIEQVMIALPHRTLNAIRLKASRLNIKRATPTMDLFLFIDRHPWINMIGPEGEKITLRAPGEKEIGK